MSVAYLAGGQPEKALENLYMMRKQDVAPTRLAYMTALRACAR
jgi:hypothetical protein